MASLTLSALSAMLRDVYHPKLVAEVMNLSPILGELPEMKGVRLEGLKMIFDVMLNESRSVDFRAEDAYLPDPAAPSAIQGQATPAYLYGLFRITKQAITMAKGKPASIKNILDNATQKMPMEMKRWLGMAFYGRKCGVMNTVTAYSSNVLTLACPDYQLNGAGIENGIADTTNYLPVTGEVPIYTGKGAARRYLVGDKVGGGTWAEVESNSSNMWYATVASVDNTNGKITVNTDGTIGTQNPAASDIIFLGVDSNTKHGFDQHWTGLGDAVHGTIDKSGTLAGGKSVIFENIDPATYATWKPYHEGNSGTKRNLIESMLITFHMNHKEYCGKEPDMHLCHPHQITNLYQSLAPRIRTTPGKMKGGYTKVSIDTPVGTMNFFPDTECHYHCMYSIVKEWCEVAWTERLQWETGDNGEILKQDPAYKHAYWGFMYGFGNYVFRNRRGLGIMSDLIMPNFLG